MISSRPPRSHRARPGALPELLPTRALTSVTLCHARVITAAQKLQRVLEAHVGATDGRLVSAKHDLHTALGRLLAAITAVSRSAGSEAQNALALHALLGDALLEPTPAGGGELARALQHGHVMLPHIRAAVEELSAKAVAALCVEASRPHVTSAELQMMADQLEFLDACYSSGKVKSMLVAARTQVREVQAWVGLMASDAGPAHAHVGAARATGARPHAPSAGVLARPTVAGAVPTPGPTPKATANPPVALWNDGVAGPQSLGPRGADGQVLRSVKVKWPRQVYAKTSFGDQVFSKLYDDEGHFLVMTATMARGTFGKVRYGVDRYGNVVAIKVLTHTFKEPYNAEGVTRPTPVDRADALKEFYKTIQLRAIIDQVLLQLSRSGSVNQRALGIVRAGMEPFVGIAAIEVDGEQRGIFQSRTYLVMSKETGDVYKLHESLKSHPSVETRQALCAAAALSVAVQGFSELAILHDIAKYAHLDLSSGNLFFSQNGQIKLMDFGTAAPLDGLGLTRSQGVVGTIATPEAAIALNLGTFYLSRAADVFSLAVVIFELASPEYFINPFWQSERIEGIAADSDGLYFTTLFAKFQQWKQERRDPVTERVTARAIIGKRGTSFLDDLFLGLAAANPSLCELLINDAMDNDPNLRLNAAELGHQCRDLLSTSHGAMTALRQQMQSVNDLEGLDDLRLKARAYDAWEQSYQASVAQQRPKRGEPRPLPG